MQNQLKIKLLVTKLSIWKITTIENLYENEALRHFLQLSHVVILQIESFIKKSLILGWFPIKVTFGIAVNF